MFTLNSVSWELGPGWAGMAHLCAVPGASAGVWLRQIAWNHMSGVSVRLSPGFLISPCGLSTWLALGSWGSIRDCSKSKSPKCKTLIKPLFTSQQPLSHWREQVTQVGDYTLGECQVWFSGSCQGKRPLPLYSYLEKYLEPKPKVLTLHESTSLHTLSEP